MKTAVQQLEAIVRVCPKHRLVLQEGRGDTLRCPRGHATDTWLVVDRKKGRAISQVDRVKGEIDMLSSKLETKAEVKDVGKTGTLAREKFTHACGETLWIRLMRVAPELNGADPYRIRFEVVSAKGTRRQGFFATAGTHLAGQERMKAATESALAQGWKQMPVIWGRRPIALQPISAPSKGGK
jgi:hypothetical protein